MVSLCLGRATPLCSRHSAHVGKAATRSRTTVVSPYKILQEPAFDCFFFLLLKPVISPSLQELSIRIGGVSYNPRVRAVFLWKPPIWPSALERHPRASIFDQASGQLLLYIRSSAERFDHSCCCTYLVDVYLICMKCTFFAHRAVFLFWPRVFFRALAYWARRGPACTHGASFGPGHAP